MFPTGSKGVLEAVGEVRFGAPDPRMVLAGVVLVLEV